MSEVNDCYTGAHFSESRFQYRRTDDTFHMAVGSQHPFFWVGEEAWSPLRGSEVWRELGVSERHCYSLQAMKGSFSGMVEGEQLLSSNVWPWTKHLTSLRWLLPLNGDNMLAVVRKKWGNGDKHSLEVLNICAGLFSSKKTGLTSLLF